MSSRVAGPCLDEAQAIAFVAGELPPELRLAAEAHVDDCDPCRQVLAALVRGVPNAATHPALVAAVTAPATTADLAGEWPLGSRVGRYVVGARIGRGGMGTVYRAEDPELGRSVALKRLHASADTETRARLIREARAAAQLAHPNVVTIYEVGDDAGTPFIAMELVDGVTLTAWCARELRSWREIVTMLVQAGRGLAAAHEHGIVHRDFKPDNVLVDRSGRARVADFGLARASDGVRGEPADDRGLGRLTSTGALSGTPAYMAPELVDGGAPNAASDQYAFAIALYEALHGHHPFKGATAPALWAEMAAGRIRDGARSIPAWLDQYVRRGLAVDRIVRWPSMTSFVDALERPSRRTWPWIALAGGVAVASMVVAVVALISTRAHEVAPAPPPVVTRTVVAPPDAAVVAVAPAIQPAPPKPKPTPKAPPTKEILTDLATSYHDDPQAALAKVERILAKEPANEWAHELAVVIACDVDYKLQRDHASAVQLAAAEAKARALADTLSPKARWDVWVECDRWAGIRLVGDVDKLGNGTIDHIGPKPPK